MGIDFGNDHWPGPSNLNGGLDVVIGFFARIMGSVD